MQSKSSRFKTFYLQSLDGRWQVCSQQDPALGLISKSGDKLHKKHTYIYVYSS